MEEQGRSRRSREGWEKKWRRSREAEAAEEQGRSDQGLTSSFATSSSFSSRCGFDGYVAVAMDKQARKAKMKGNETSFGIEECSTYSPRKCKRYPRCSFNRPK